MSLPAEIHIEIRNCPRHTQEQIEKDIEKIFSDFVRLLGNLNTMSSAEGDRRVASIHEKFLVRKIRAREIGMENIDEVTDEFKTLYEIYKILNP